MIYFTAVLKQLQMVAIVDDYLNDNPCQLSFRDDDARIERQHAWAAQPVTAKGIVTCTVPTEAHYVAFVLRYSPVSHQLHQSDWKVAPAPHA